MTSEAFIALAILGLTIVLFVSDRLRLDVVAMLSLLALAITGVATASEALAGFSNPAVIMIAGLFVIGAALTDTGVADWLGQRLERLAGGGEAQVIVAAMGATALLSAFMSSTGTVAILLPVVGTLAMRRGIAPARIFMPVAFAAHLGSNLTLISTPPNLLVSDALRQAGRAPFRFFSFTVPGLIVLALGVAYLAWIGRRALPGAADRADARAPRPLSLDDLSTEYGLGGALRALRVPPGARLAGLTLGQANLRAAFGVTVIGIARPGPRGLEAQRVVPTMAFAAGDELRLLGSDAAIAAVADSFGLEALGERPTFSLPPEESLAEVVLPRRSSLAGQSLREARFRDRYRANVLSIRRGDGSIPVFHSTPELRDIKLRAGDTLLVKGRLKHLKNLRDERRDLVLVAEPDARGEALVDRGRALLAVGITLGMLVCMAFGWLPNVIAVLLAASLLVLARCVRPVDVYRSVNWESVVLIAGMVPLAAALERTGAMGAAVSALEGLLAGARPTVVLGLLVLFTSAIGMVLSNTATAVLMAPLAVRLAGALGLAPEPLLLGVAFASSAAFATPIASPVNILVMGPGGYHFKDFTRVGLPLQLLVLATTVIVVPLVFRF
ncbi:SLC13 family permease [Sorangium sp. So ce1036]|uniref:SLC13 family permease n=1 Tax=Sorangium sp. So ce1036 TaxID=3133328 RepID=UPI003EFD8550